jgi:hypothetical protein
MNLDLRNLVSGEISTSELSDESCRLALRTLINRHAQALLQLETAYHQEKGTIQWIQQTTQ